ncbi:MAG: tRNA epoxyqueuosine(34) reductase QueG [Candidatus Kapabacteria bacterium]|jgi:epoxyqueuosine reductase|nr:tRNA epoxyqueuosine(34) reductase QueG [Candidatus Kapabacteria bacterium]
MKDERQNYCETTPDVEQQTRHVKAFALQCGFSSVGIAEAVPLEQETERFSEWLRMGFHAGLGYMERNADKRYDVRNILPETRSVIVVAQNYYTPHQHNSSGENTQSLHGKISRYAWGDDYHDVLPPKLEQIADEIKRLQPQAQTKVYTDTGAILEKQWAVRAGIGWQGKHSNVISRDIGSWFFIGIILTTAEFLYDTPMRDFCGTCDACMQACPTQAIVQPYVVDARRCIPYWTIETKPDTEFPPNIAQNLDSWLFGCDTCQDVCPWNRFQTPTDESRFQPRFEETALDIHALRQMTQEQFSERFRKSPIKRSKMAGLKRNAQTLFDNTLPHKKTDSQE